jgi:hypothetical protein
MCIEIRNLVYMLQTYSFVYFPSWGNKKTCIETYSFVVISFVLPVGYNKYIHRILLVASLLSPVFYEFSLIEGLAYYGNKLCLYSVNKDEDVRFSL